MSFNEDYSQISIGWETGWALGPPFMTWEKLPLFRPSCSHSLQSLECVYWLTVLSQANNVQRRLQRELNETEIFHTALLGYIKILTVIFVLISEDLRGNFHKDFVFCVEKIVNI
jgi:hypothetical protein